MSATVKVAGGITARGVLFRRSESPSNEPDRAGQGKTADGDQQGRSGLCRRCNRRGRRADSKRAGSVKTARERAEEKRQEKLELVRAQVESGSLVIRKMTKEERRRYPPKPAHSKRDGKR